MPLETSLFLVVSIPKWSSAVNHSTSCNALEQERTLWKVFGSLLDAWDGQTVMLGGH